MNHVRLTDALPAGGRWDRATLRLRLGLYACGVGDAAQLRGWHRWMLWRQHPGVRWRAWRLALVALLPATAARQAGAAVRKHGAEITGACGVSRSRQFAQLWWLRLRHGITTDAYLTFQLYRPERRRLAARYIQVRELVSAMVLANERRGAHAEAATLADKRRCEAWCVEHGLRTVRTLLEIEGGRVTGGTAAPDALPPGDLFSKPACGELGVGAQRWRYDGAGGYRDGDGRSRRPDELVAELAAASARFGQAMLVQECLRNHSALRQLTPGGLCTMRLVTYRRPGGGVELLVSVYRMPVGDSVVDNVAQGAAAAHIDPATGRLGPAVRRQGRLFIDADRHPDTGAQIAGTALPDWAEAVDLVLRAHSAIERLIVIGWDVALLDDGPVLVEGNSLPSSRVMQLASGVPLADTPLVRELNQYIRETFAI